MSAGDTIAAIATPPGRGGVGMVRLSGAQSGAIAKQLAPAWPSDSPSHQLRRARLVAPDGAMIDEAMIVIMRAPRSYTGEEVVELHCHGGPMILQRVMDAARAFGARTARPGEFTERAFLHGKLDLTQAEAVADLIDATSASAHQLALEHLSGRLGDAIRAHLRTLTEVAMLIEAALDFSHEEHVYQIERDAILQRLDAVRDALITLRDGFDQGRRQREGVRVAIVGPPNAGKSTLFNHLYGDERAIVTPIAGTTRDFLEEQIQLGDVTLRLIDTAGLRQTEDMIEAQGIARSRQWRARAELVIWLVDRSVGLDEGARRELLDPNAPTRPTLILINKADLPDALSGEDRAQLARMGETIELSLHAPTAEQQAALRDALRASTQALTRGEGVLLSRARHLDSVVLAIEACERARDAVIQGHEHELIALDVREALDALGAIVGRVSVDDVLNALFSTFCVGK